MQEKERLRKYFSFLIKKLFSDQISKMTLAVSSAILVQLMISSETQLLFLQSLFVDSMCKLKCLCF